MIIVEYFQKCCGGSTAADSKKSERVIHNREEEEKTRNALNQPNQKEKRPIFQISVNQCEGGEEKENLEKEEINFSGSHIIIIEECHEIKSCRKGSLVDQGSPMTPEFASPKKKRAQSEIFQSDNFVQRVRKISNEVFGADSGSEEPFSQSPKKDNQSNKESSSRTNKGNKIIRSSRSGRALIIEEESRRSSKGITSSKKTKKSNEWNFMQNDPREKLDRSPSGEIRETIENKKAIRKGKALEDSLQMVQAYDAELKRSRGRSQSRKKISKIAGELVDTTKNQKNRANVTQLLRGKSLHSIKSLSPTHKNRRADQNPDKSNGFPNPV